MRKVFDVGEYVSFKYWDDTQVHTLHGRVLVYVQGYADYAIEFEGRIFWVDENDVWEV